MAVWPRHPLNGNPNFVRGHCMAAPSNFSGAVFFRRRFFLVPF